MKQQDTGNEVSGWVGASEAGTFYIADVIINSLAMYIRDLEDSSRN